MSDDEISYITDKIIPTAETLLELAPEDDRPASEILDAIKTLVSVETLTILQVMGFNFKAAIGQPLTSLVERLILSRVPPADASAELSLLAARRELAYLEIVRDSEASARLQALNR